MKKDTVVIQAVVIKDLSTWEYVPVQISVKKYNGEKCVFVYESMVNPNCNIDNTYGLPKYISKEVLNQAPSVYTVARYVKEATSGCTVRIEDKTTAEAYKKMIKLI